MLLPLGDAGMCWDECLPLRILTDIDFYRVLVWWALVVVDAGIFGVVGVAVCSWFVSGTAKSAWTVLIFF